MIDKTKINSQYESAFAHEVGHLLTNTRHVFNLDLVGTPNEGKASVNLMTDIVTDEDEISDSKRLWENQQDVIHVSPHAKNP